MSNSCDQQTQEDTVDPFISNRPNIPSITEFKKEQPTTVQDEYGFQKPSIVGPNRPSDEEDYESDEEAFEPEYDRLAKHRKLNNQQAYQVDDSSDEDDFIDPATLARDPALKELLANRAASKAIDVKPQDGELPSHDLSQRRIFGLPISHELIIKGHSKQATAMGIDGAGSRLVTGAYDCVVRFWDFHGMDKNMHSFRLVTPFEGNPIYTINWAKDGKNVLICCGDMQACVLDREGKRTMDTHRGDMYIRDILKTLGHTSSVVCGQFHPDYSDAFITCSHDGTIRVWDMTKKLYGVAQCLTHKDAVKCTDKKGHKVKVECVTVRGTLILAYCNDNTIHAYETIGNCRGIRKRPLFVIDAAHKDLVTKIRILADCKRFITQSVDNTIKLWDIRNPVHHIYVHYCYINRFPPTRFDLNKDESLLVTADHHFKDGYHVISPTELLFLNTIDLSVYCRIALFDQAVTDVVWHPILNQIFIGGDDGHVRALFDPKLSSKGTLLAISRATRFVHAENMEYERHVIIPENLYIFKQSETKHGGMKIVEEKKDLRQLPRKPEPPQNGPGKGGKISGPSTLTQQIMRLLNDRPKQEDVVEELTKWDEYTKAHPQYVAQAYRMTQPEQIFDTNTYEQEEHILLSSIKKICPHCGMKICACKRKVVQS